jgi:hypothetical protein
LGASDRKDFEKWVEQFAEQQIKSRFQRCRNECLELLSGIEGLNDERLTSLKDPKLVTNSPLVFGCQLHAKIEKTSTDDLFEFLELCNSYFYVQVDGSIECKFSTTGSPSRELVVMVVNRMHGGVEATREQIADLNAALRPTPEQLENMQAKIAKLKSRIGEVDASEIQTEYMSIKREVEEAAIKRLESIFVPVQMDYLNQVIQHRCIVTIGPWQLIESIDCKQFPITRNIKRETAASLKKAQALFSRFEEETFDEFVKGCNDNFPDVVRELDLTCGQLWREPLPMRTWFLIGK